jgi:hypothetical protein
MYAFMPSIFEREKQAAIAVGLQNSGAKITKQV